MSKRQLKPVLIILSFLMLFSGCKNQKKQNTTNEIDKKLEKLNVILMIGDGMGLSQMSSAYFFGDKEPNFSRFPIVGLSKTSSGSHKITDSGAGATAFSIGKKTYNGAIGVDLDTNFCKTILELLKEQGWSTGIISTSSITHATPASFYSHVASRENQYEIAKQLVYSDLDFVAGGGTRWFNKRDDAINYLDSLYDKGYYIDTNNLLIDQAHEKEVFLLASDGLLAKHLGRDDFLNKATKRALNFMKKKEAPFFLVIEGSQIDWGGHANQGSYVTEEVLDFDRAIGTVLDFAQDQKNTLVIVTADHETGGFTLSSDQKTGPFRQIISNYDSIIPTFSTSGHSSTMVPVLAFGPFSPSFSGIYENTKIYSLIKEASKIVEY